MRSRHDTPSRSERGTIAIVVALSILILIAFTAFVVDLGMMFVARNQAQNAADAGALAGAIARGYDETGDPGAAGPAFNAAYNAATAHQVWHQAPGAVVTFDCPPGVTGGRCVRVDTFRDGTNGSTALPGFFAPILSATPLKTKATATAQALIANASECLRPWAVTDHWNELLAPVNYYNHWSTCDKKTGVCTPFPPPVDSYSQPETGYNLTDDLGTQLVLKVGQYADNVQLQKNWFLAVDLPNVEGGYDTGGADYRNNIARPCNESTVPSAPVAIGDYLPIEPGNKEGPTVQGVDDLVALDPGAQWVGGVISGGCMAAGTCVLSPRVVAIAVFDPDRFQRSQLLGDWSYCPTSAPCVQITNIFGLFVEPADAQGNVTGRIMKISGTRPDDSGWIVGEPSAFLWMFQIVR